MAAPSPAGLRLNSVRLRFVSRKTERDYQRWRNEQALPAVRLAFLVSIPAWIATPLLGYLWLPQVDWIAVWRLGFVLVIPVVALSAIATWTAARRLATLLGAIGLAVAGSVMLWVITVPAQVATGLETTGPAVATCILNACFALFMRLPPSVAVVAILPFIAAALGLVVRHTSVAEIPLGYGYAYVVTLCNTYLFVGVISLVAERFFRNAFVTERLLVERNAALDHSQSLIRRYVPQALADDIISGKVDVKSPERLRVTILFSDIVDFTAIADRVEPEVITQVISEYMAAMVEIVEKHGGTVNEFMGDGLMALFGAPTPLLPEDQARSAVAAATSMQKRLHELQGQWRQLGLAKPIAIRVGINTGVASVGSYGSAGRMTYTAIGLQTNIAARIQAQCKPGGILMSEATWLLVKDQIMCQSVGEIECKGVHFPVPVYSPSESDLRFESAA